MWHLDGTLASADFGNIALKIALATGDRKVLLETSDTTLLANLWDLPMVSTLPLVDAYVRGHDLVCTLGPTESFSFHTQLYWTLRHLNCTPAPLAAISLLVSLRTDLLDTHPVLEVCSSAPSRGLTAFNVAGGPAYVVPLRESVTLVDFATPKDCARQTTRQTKDGMLCVERLLFDHFLEKGVIRSGRLFAAVMAGDIDEHTANEACLEMLATELPLTT